jgi:hypothetical protein
LRDIGLKQGEQERRGQLGHNASPLLARGEKRKPGGEGRKCRRGLSNRAWPRSFRLWTTNSINAKNRVER